MGHSQERAGYRHARLEALLLDELRSLLQDEVRDPLLQAVRPTSLRLSVDYRNARVDFLLADTADAPAPERDEVEEALERASSFLRYQLAQAVELKRTPELRFVFQGTAVDGPIDTSDPLSLSPPRRTPA